MGEMPSPRGGLYRCSSAPKFRARVERERESLVTSGSHGTEVLSWDLQAGPAEGGGGDSSLCI